MFKEFEQYIEDKFFKEENSASRILKRWSHFEKTFMQRWVYSTNHKDIGTLYLIFGTFSGIIGTIFSVIIRLELAEPGCSILNFNPQLYNVIVTAHAFIMIFFLLCLSWLGGTEID